MYTYTPTRMTRSQAAPQISIASLAVGVVLQSSCLFAATPPYSEDWSAGNTNGWIQSTTSSVVVRDATFGNPAGSLAVRRDLTPNVFDMGATSELPAISGNYTGPPALMISFDAYYDSGNYTDTWLRFRYQGPANNGWHLDVADAFPSSWQSYSVMFDPSWTNAQAAGNGWVDETGGTISWQQMMTDVYHPEIRFILGDDLSALAHIDNFVFKAVPEPVSGGLLLMALGALAVSRQVCRRSS